MPMQENYRIESQTLMFPHNETSSHFLTIL